MTLDKSMARIISLVRFWRLVAWWFQLGPLQMLGKRGDREIMIIHPTWSFPRPKEDAKLPPPNQYQQPGDAAAVWTPRRAWRFKNGPQPLVKERRSALNWYPPFPKLRESDQAWIWLVEGPIWFGYKVPGLSIPSLPLSLGFWLYCCSCFCG